jgi:hypothetical protein
LRSNTDFADHNEGQAPKRVRPRSEVEPLVFSDYEPVQQIVRSYIGRRSVRIDDEYDNKSGIPELPDVM